MLTSEENKGILQFLGWAVIFVVVFTVLGFILHGTFAPQNMAIQNQVFQQSQQHIDSANHDVAHYWDEYNQPNEDSDHKRGITATMKDEFSTFDTSKLTPTNQQHLSQMENGN